MGVSKQARVTGHLQVRGKEGSRRWHALWRDEDGRHHAVLGPAHVRASGRKTERGATIWRPVPAAGRRRAT